MKTNKMNMTVVLTMAFILITISSAWAYMMGGTTTIPGGGSNTTTTINGGGMMVVVRCLVAA